MYGLVNLSFQNFITSNHGESMWEIIRQMADVEVEIFVAMDSYDDAITYSLVGAAIEKLGIEGSELLTQYGEYWVLETAQKHYGDFLQSTGNSVPEVLGNLDQMHSRIKLSFPNLMPPSFRCTDITENSLTLHYYSDRPGLQPFVIGLVQGIGKMLDTPTTISCLSGENSESDHDIFLVSF
ncbi:MAG: heme NO-binding domain-containing protein [Planctomycetes bacterium]|nr:heme NO-binding domain-containing protein [Planctomycetota bacterium]